MNTITVKALAEQLARLVELGHGEDEVLYLDADSMAYTIESGVHDVWHTKDGKTTVVLG